MFMWGVANPDLKAESIWNYEASYSQWLFNNRMQYGINLFYLKGDNMITVASVDGRIPHAEGHFHGGCTSEILIESIVYFLKIFYICNVLIQ